MAGEIKTDIVVTAKPQGFAKLRDEAGRLNEEVRKGVSGQTEGLKEADKAADKFSVSIEKAMKSILGGVRAREELKRMTTQIGDLTKQVDRLKRKFSEAGEAGGAFTQGLAQGFGAGEFIQRGPGMGRQLAGRTIGASARLPIAGMMGGTGGFTGALSRLPGGSVAALPFQFAQQAVGFQRQQLGAMPFLMGGGVAGGARRAAANQFPMPSTASPELGYPTAPVTAQDIRERRNLRTRGIGAPSLTDIALRRPNVQGYLSKIESAGGTDDEIRAQIQAERYNTAEERDYAEYKSARDASLAGRRGVRRRTKRRAFGGITKAGKEFGGMPPEQALQFAQQLQQTAGGVGTVRGGELETAIAAQTAYGVGADVTGMFSRAGRRGGLVGAQERGGAQVTADALKSAISLGMEGSEINDFLSQIASGIQNFERTGIPINRDAIQGIGTVLQAGGLTGRRLQNVMGGVMGGIQNVGRQGPRGAVDMFAMSQLGGFKGGGIDEMVNSMIRLEQGDIDPKDFSNFVTNLARVGGGGGAGILTVQGALNQLDANLGTGETKEMMARAKKGELTPEYIKTILNAQATGPAAAVGTPKGVQAMAKAMLEFTPAVKRQADIQTLQLESGKKMITAMQNLEMSATIFNSTAGKVLGPLLTDVTEMGVDLAKALRSLVTMLSGRSPNSSLPPPPVPGVGG